MSKPNLLLIMCDQLRFDALGCYGNRIVQTPNIDRLAARSVVFDNAYSQTPVCVPARYGLLSGLHPFQLGLVDHGPLKRTIDHPLPAMLKKSGYFTCAVGKMHFTPVREHYGFDRMYLSEEIAQHIQDDDYLLFLREKGYGHIAEPHGERSEHYYVPQTSKLPEDLHSDAWTAQKAIEVIRGNHNRPFFVFASFIKPHPPFDPCPPYNDMYSPEELSLPLRHNGELKPDDYSIDVQNDYKVNGIENVSDVDVLRIRSAYYGMITQLDKQIGSILDALDEYGVTDDTLVIFTSDHGEMLGDHYAFGKRSFYESSTRIPLLMSWPAAISKPCRTDQLVILQDIYATFISAARGIVPEESSGKNLLGVFEDNDVPLRDKAVGEFGRNQALKFMLRTGVYKYIFHANGAREQLFNLETDPDEMCNVAERHADLCARFKSELEAYYKLYSFDEALSDGSLISYPFEKAKRNGYLNQYPDWPKTVMSESWPG